MASGGKGLAVLALLVGIGSLGFSFYMYAIVIPSQTGDNTIQKIYYDSSVDPFVLSSSFTDIPLELLISVDEGDNIYISFVGEFTVDSGTCGGVIRLRIDDATQLGSRQRFYSDSPGSLVRDSISLQYVVYNMTAGIHKIGIQANVGACSGSIESMNLFAYTFT